MGSDFKVGDKVRIDAEVVAPEDFENDVKVSIGGQMRFVPVSHITLADPDHTAVAPDRMTRSIWNTMTTEQRRDWNRPAYEALGEKSVEYQVCDSDRWRNAMGAVDINHPHRVKPEPKPVPRMWLVTEPDGMQRMEFNDGQPRLDQGATAVELVLKAGGDLCPMQQ